MNLMKAGKARASSRKSQRAFRFADCRPVFIITNVLIVLVVVAYYSPPFPGRTRKLVSEVEPARAGTARAGVLSTGKSQDKVEPQRDTSGQNEKKYWLTIGIPTVPRRGNVDYLRTTVETLVQELPQSTDDPFFGKVRVIVMNNRPGEHVVFDQLRQQYTGSGAESRTKAAASHIEFVDNPGTVVDPHPELPDPDDLNNPSSRPGRRVREQTCGVISLLRMVHDSEYYMFMEDDFKTCRKACTAITYALGYVDAMVPDWLAMRVSYGMNGILFRTKDLEVFADYLWKNVARLPPDLLWTAYMEGRAFDERGELTRVDRGKLAVFRYNLFDHIGTVSSFAIRPDRPAWPGCYESMALVWSLQQSERFDQSCSTDVSPCIGPGIDIAQGRTYQAANAFNRP